MSSEGFIVANPKGNNVDLEITFVGLAGTEKKYKTLKPGEGCRVDKKVVTVTERRHPPRLLATRDGYVPDVDHR